MIEDIWIEKMFGKIASFWKYRKIKTAILILSKFASKTGMRKFGPWGVLWSLCLRYFPSRYDPETWHTGQGCQMRHSEFFFGQNLFWWLQNGASKRPCGSWVLSDWEEMGSWNFAGSFLDSIQDLEIFFSSIGQSIVLKFQFFWDNSRNHKVSWFAY